MGVEKPSASTKELILQAAFEVFLEKGMHVAGTQQIADRAEVNKAMIYYYFDSKEDLFVEVYRRAIEESGIKSIKILEEETPLFEKIRRCIARITDRMKERPALSAFVMNELSRQPELLRDILAGELEFDASTLSRQLSEAADRYEIARIETGDLMVNILTLCMGPVASADFYMALLEMENENEFAGFVQNRSGVIYDVIVSWLTS